MQQADQKRTSKQKYTTKKNQKPKPIYIDKYMYYDIPSHILGQGAFGCVYKGYLQPQFDLKNEQKPLAIKLQKLPNQLDDYEQKESFNSIRHDIITLKLLDHPNIVRLIDVKRKDKNVYMIMEFCNQKDLNAYLGNREVSEVEICYMFSQILQAFKFMHAQRLMHRDIKPQNIMVNDNTIKVGDFGFAKQFGNEKQPVYKIHQNEDLLVEKESNYYVINLKNSSNEKQDKYRMCLIQQPEIEDTTKNFNFRFTINQLMQGNDVIFGICDVEELEQYNKEQMEKAQELKDQEPKKKSVQVINQKKKLEDDDEDDYDDKESADKKKEQKAKNEIIKVQKQMESENTFIFDENMEVEKLLAIQSNGNIIKSLVGGGLDFDDQEFKFNLNEGDNVQCRVNFEQKLCIFLIQNQNGDTEQEFEVNLRLQQSVTPKNLCVFAGIKGFGDQVSIIMTNAPKLYQSFKGTLLTVAPQVIEGFYSDKCDIYSLGCTLYWMIYRNFLYQDIKNQFRINTEQKKNQFNFPDTPKISDDLKQALVSMLQYKEDDRIEWEDLFRLPIFNMQNLIENNDLNIINLVDYDAVNYDLVDIDEIIRQVEEEFDLQKPLDFSEQDDDEQQEQLALEYIQKVETNLKRKQITSEMIQRITFEKGRTQVIRMVTKNVNDLRILNKIIRGEDRIVIDDYLYLIKFGCVKFELIVMKRTYTELCNQNDGYIYYGKSEEDWKLFQNTEDNKSLDELKKAVNKEISLFQNMTFNLALKEVIQKYKDQRPKEINDNNYQDFFSTQFEGDSVKQFFVTFFNIIINVIKLLKKPILKNQQNHDKAFQRVKDLIYIVDDLLLILSLEQIFIWDPQAPINFSTFFEKRKQLQNQQVQFQVIFERVTKALETFFD